MKFTIEPGTSADIDELEKLYDELNDYLAATTNYPGWIKGVYPVREDAVAGVNDETLYVARYDGRIVGSVILNHQPEKAYENVKWKIELDHSHIFVIHTFVVYPSFLKIGVGHALMDYSLELAQSSGIKSVRLDVYEKNLPAIVQKAPGQTVTSVPSVEGMESPDTKENYYEESSGETSDNSRSSGQKTSAGEIKATDSGTTSDFDAADSTVTELSTDTITAISGQRLLLMLQQNGIVRFEKQGISVTILPETINTWKVAANDEIQMRIEKTAESAFSLRIFVRGEEVTEIPGSTAEFQTSVFGEISSPETVTVADAQGNLCAVTWQEKQKILRVEIEKTGDYFISEASVSGQADKTETDLTEASVSDADTVESAEVISDGEADSTMAKEVNAEGLSEKQKIETGKICGLLSVVAVGLILLLILRKKRNNIRNR